ncbi:expressed unknown protein [Seminavis robusta]|uniref:Uncharacterized protein n=1 Tax=Seminavis robusta TaxID=568900 RepID=A0A9N8EHT7_9STRA|nr:expressed unknown protein [Seminavis robusta]|eukprot:Sro1189_g250680.3  (3098) ;mRNA; r:7257-16550
MEDYWYVQQAPYQIAFSSTFDPDDENFSLQQPPPPKLTKVFSGTARADWEQVVRDMPPQERSNWLEQQQQQQRQHRSNSGDSKNILDALHLQYQQSSSSSSPEQSTEEWVFEVRTTVLIQSSRGTVQLPIRASSRRQNPYGVPDVIYFDEEADDDTYSNNNTTQSGGKSRKDNTKRQQQQQSKKKTAATTATSTSTKGVLWLDTDLAPAETPADTEEDDDDEISPSTSRDCYNLFMTNPSSTEDLRVSEVFLSRPDLMNLQIHGQLRAPSQTVTQWWNTAPRQDGQEKEIPDQLGALLIEPGEQRYVVTVCTAGNTSAYGDYSYDSKLNDEDEFGPIVVDEGEENVKGTFASAARTAARALLMASSAKFSLGFIHIKTEAGENFFVALERLRKQCRTSAGGAGSGTPNDRNNPQSSPSLAPAEHPSKQQVYPPSYHHALYQMEMQPTEELVSLYDKASTVAAPATPLVTSALQSIPPRVDFSLLSSSSPTVVSYLSIHNPKDYPIKIMRSGVAVEIEDELDSSQPNPEELGLHMSVKIKNSYLEPNAVTKEALKITCSIRWDRFQSHNLESLFFHGNAILRATAHVDFDYNQWIKNLVTTNSKRQQGKILIANDYAEPGKADANSKQTEFVLEIPLSVSMVQGKIGIMIHRTSHPFPHLWAVQSWQEGLGSVSSIFYPQKPFDIRAELDSGEGPLTEPIFGQEGIEHKLRIFANINIPSRAGNRHDDYQPQSLQLASATVLDEDEEQGDDSSGESGQNDDICGRFHVSVGPPPHDDFPFHGFNDVGLVHIEYSFPDPAETEVDASSEDEIEDNGFPAYPKYCYLSLTTDPYTELHQIPLIVYPGQTEITATQAPDSMLQSKHKRKKNRKKKRKKNKPKEKDVEAVDVEASGANSHAIVGFDGLLDWFQTTTVGESLKNFLVNTSDRDWGWSKRQNDEQLLRKYVASLCGKSMNLRTAHLRPILMKVGAIRHGTVESSSFYLTNHNPIPLLVSVDVGEVEGMSISLARTPTRGQGDGQNILDHFPKRRNSAMGGPFQHLVAEGEYEGHPLEGLRKFLKTTDVAQEFLSVFRYRDAISLSHPSVDRQPLLDTLYKKYAFGEFHRDPLPIRFGQDGWSRCRRRKKGQRSSRQFVEPDYEYNSTSTYSDDEGLYLSDEYNTRTIRAGRGPLMVSDDYSTPRPLKVCWDKVAEPMEYPSDGTYTIIPPGSVARFEVKLHAPPKSMLKDDITRFLSTGLVLSTDHGEILPIFVSFEALLGEVQVAKPKAAKPGSQSIPPQCARADSGKKHSGKAHSGKKDTSTSNATVMQVPANLFHEALHDLGDQLSTTDNQVCAGLDPTRHDQALPLRLKSSFSRDTRLVGVSSCNPWFEVTVDEDDGSRPFLPGYREAGYQKIVDIGAVRSTIRCNSRWSYISKPAYPSFYQCALKWLSERSELQPGGCGVSTSTRSTSSNDDSNMVHVAEHSGVRRAVKAFEKALLVSSFAFGSSRNETSSVSTISQNENKRRLPSGDGLVPPLVLDVFAEAWDAWRVVADYGLRKLSSTLKATIEYDSVGRHPGKISNAQNLSVSMRDMILQTVLAAPKLFDCLRATESDAIADAVIGDDDSPSVVEFTPTRVADVSSLTIPLRNPTAVPVRVRLVTVAPPKRKNASANSGTSEKDPVKAKFSAEEEVRNAFIKSSSPPFVQNKKLNTTTQHYHAGVIAEQLWWDGAGGYFLADEYGDLVRSHHNIRIMAGAGAHVSLANPSLHSNVALLVGCGARCGVRDEKHSPFMQDGNESKLTSPLGASAAAGITLSGRIRANLPQLNGRSSEEPVFAAGAASPGGMGGGPAAFAIPFSALDEVVIPPFGEAEIGPVLFRPPGRHSVHGCQSASDSRIVSMAGNAERSKACGENVYESMIFLENSLTGLERISLRGKALWERLVFLDPPPADTHLGDEFGDVELRYGHSALIFSGSKSTGEATSHQLGPTVPGSVIKEVVVHNPGDTTMDFESVYLSDTSKLHYKHSTSMSYRKHDNKCSMSQFRLLNCVDSASDAEDGEGIQSVNDGFSLDPGESISLFVEHFPDCKKPHDFIAVNLERRRQTDISPPKGRFGLLSSAGNMQEPQRRVGMEMNDHFRRRKFQLLVGYEMSDDEFKSCAPVQRWGLNVRRVNRGVRCSTKKKGCKESWFSRMNHRIRWYGVMTLGTVVLSGCIAFSYAAIYKGYLFRRQSTLFFAFNLTGRRKTPDNGASDKPLTQPGGRGNWAAAFRCLARADPSSSDLQTLGREQIRHVLLGRYRTLGVLSPQCLSNNGVFNRERGGVATSGSPSRQVGGKDGQVSSGDRARTLSDAIYRHMAVHQDPHLQSSLPRGLTWRAAVGRGMKLPNLSEKPGRLLRTSELLLQRVARAKVEADAPEDEAVDQLNYHHDLGQESSEGSQQTDDVSDEQLSDGDESQLQESFVSELSEEQGPETPDDTSEEPARREPAEDAKAASGIEPILDERAPVLVEEAKPGEIPGETTSDTAEIPVEIPEEMPVEIPAEMPVEIPAEMPVEIPAEMPIKPPPSPESPKEEKKIPDAPNGSEKRTKIVPGAAEARVPKQQKQESNKKETGPAPQSQKKKESKRDRRNRHQKARAPSPFKSDAVDVESVTSSQAKPNQPKEKVKSTEAKGQPRSGKSKAAAEKPKQAGKTSQNQRDKKANTASLEPKSGKGPESEDKSNNKRRAKKTDASSQQKQAKDTSNKGVQNEKKPKSGASKKGKKGKAAKGTPAATVPAPAAAAAQSQSVGEKTQQNPPKQLASLAGSSPPRPKPTEAPPVLRPPPGLAPPPGFGAQDATAPPLSRPTYEAPLLPPSAFLSDASILGSPSSTVLGTPARSLGDSAFGALSPSILNVSGEHASLAGINSETPLRGVSSVLPRSAAGEALLASVASTPLDRPLESPFQPPRNSADGFDVMDFLDSILNEGNSAPPPEASPQRPSDPFLAGNRSPVPALASTTPVQPPLTSTPLQPLFSSDPWATERQPRALAYGITIDDNGGAAKDLTSASLHSLGESQDSNPIPLLDTAAILSVPVVDDASENTNPIPLLNTAPILYARDGDDDDDDEDNGDSFYANLLAGLNPDNDDNSGF